MNKKQEKIRIGGAKLGKELVQLNLWGREGWKHSKALYRELAKRKIALHFLSTVCCGEHLWTSCCMSPPDRESIQSYIDGDSSLREHISWIDSVCLISMYPHRHDLGAVILALSEFGKASIPVYGMASSLSSLTFSTPYDLVEKARSVLSQCFAEE